MDSLDILNSVFEYLCETCIGEDESREAILSKFGGDKLKAIKYLRDREYQKWIKDNKKPADAKSIQDKVDAAIKQNKEDTSETRLIPYDKQVYNPSTERSKSKRSWKKAKEDTKTKTSGSKPAGGKATLF